MRTHFYEKNMLKYKQETDVKHKDVYNKINTLKKCFLRLVSVNFNWTISKQIYLNYV